MKDCTSIYSKNLTLSWVVHWGQVKLTSVDTTGAGDTFVGYFLAKTARGSKIEDCLKIATKAAALCVTRKGAAASIPKRSKLY